MALFLTTFIVFALCCAGLGLGILLGGGPMAGGCDGPRNGVGRCSTCPRKNINGRCSADQAKRADNGEPT